MTQRKMLFKTAAVILSFLLLFGTFPVSAFAADSAASSSGITEADAAAGAASVYDLYGEDYVVDAPDAAPILEEEAVPDNRVRSEEGDSLHTIVTDNGDGTHTMTLYDYPVKYVNESGRTEDISLEITAAPGGGYKTKSAESKTLFPAKISEGISLTGNGVNINLKPVMPVVPSGASANGFALPIVTDSRAAKLDDETVSYAYDSKTAIEYSLTYTGFKEDIVVSEYTGQTEYGFLLVTGGLALTEKDGSFCLTDENGEIKAEVGDIIIFTADERNNTFGKLTYETVEENERYIMTIHVDADYLKDEKTVYPIRIDPTIEITYGSDGSAAIQDVTINSNAGSDGASGSLYVGKRQDEGISRVLMRFHYNFKNMFDSNPLLIHRAYVELRDLMCEGEKMTVETNLYIGPDWEESTAAWENTNGAAYTHYMAGVSVNYDSGSTKEPKHRYQISVLDAVKYWVSGEHDANKGIVIKASNAVEGGSGCIHKTFASFNRSEFKPSLTIVYYHLHEQYADPVGYLDKVDINNIRGWAWCVDLPDSAVTVKLYIENQTTGVKYPAVTAAADIYRSDLHTAGYGTGKYGFMYPMNWSSYTPGYYKITAKAVSMNGTGTEFDLYTNPKYYENNPGRQFLDEGEYYINNKEHGRYLKNISGQAAAQSGTLSDLGSGIKWILTKCKGGYTIQNAADPAKYLAVSTDTSINSVVLRTPNGEITYEYVWVIKLSGGCYIRSFYNGRYLYTDGSGIFVDSSAGSYNTVTDREHTWRVVSTGEYGNSQSFNLRELPSEYSIDDIIMDVNDVRTPVVAIGGLNVLWADSSDFIYSYDNTENYIELNSNTNNTTDITALNRGNLWLVVTHKVSGIQTNFNICIYSSLSDTIDNFNILLSLAKSYNKELSDREVLMLALQFIRRGKYNNQNWNTVAGTINSDFVSLVETSNPKLYRYFTVSRYEYNIHCPSGLGDIDFPHFCATLNGLLYDSTGFKATLAGEVNINNLCGWAGDLQTLVKDVLDETNHSQDFSIVYNKTYNLMGSTSKSFSMADLMADTDAYNIYNILNYSDPISSFIIYYNIGIATRFTDFTNGWSKEQIYHCARIYTDNEFVPWVEWPLLNGVDVSELEADAIAAAFTDFIWELVQDE